MHDTAAQAGLGPHPAALRALCAAARRGGNPSSVHGVGRAARQDVEAAAAVAAYLDGRTPNPCVACNGRIKFPPLWQRARALGGRRWPPATTPGWRAATAPSGCGGRATCTRTSATWVWRSHDDGCVTARRWRRPDRLAGAGGVTSGGKRCSA